MGTMGGGGGGGGNPVMDIPGGNGIFLVITREKDKLRPYELLGCYAEFTYLHKYFIAFSRINLPLFKLCLAI